MIGRVAKDLVSGLVALVALYGVAKVAYSAGQEMNEMTRAYEAMQAACLEAAKDKDESLPEASAEETDTKEISHAAARTVSVPKKKGIFSTLKNSLGSKIGVVTGVMANPGKMEATVDGEDVVVRIKKQ